ncbi:DNA polymerase III subunit delta' [Pontimonas sp.]|uniref:DNA polymerase III subunit delta' n=1 Tax=Pontimonas sp. TaxID=2304492 RepID=UPI0028704877|nr:DNA polymerase III subunit delta' [Pontimonas sp.]MDR9396072.1 DNA polymerase III subunit delta' [Pontimonas sp.]MDR9434753.1 DNA polymerase III subunit delta' [Pontimonas sp.]
MSLWDQLVGQETAIAAVRAAAQPGSQAMTHAWMVVGPAGSGRSTLAHAFAATLVSNGNDDEALAHVMAGTHPDVTLVATDRVTISIDEVRELVTQSYYSPSQSKWRVIVMEDADRMTERTSNVLLKALEEPPPHTVWILCAPSVQDVLPTIYSRVRTITLRTPTVEQVATLIHQRHGVELEVATMAAREAQSHIGMATRLATDAEARARRDETVKAVLSLNSVSGAVNQAAHLIALAGADQKALLEKLDQQEREDTLRSLGVAPGGSVPAAIRGSVKALEDNQKRRATRSLRDGVDRIATDITSVLRDVLMLQVGSGEPLVNERHRPALEERAGATTAHHTLAAMEHVQIARDRIAGNTPPQLALEAMLIAISARVPLSEAVV